MTYLEVRVGKRGFATSFDQIQRHQPKTTEISACSRTDRYCDSLLAHKEHNRKHNCALDHEAALAIQEEANHPNLLLCQWAFEAPITSTICARTCLLV